MGELKDKITDKVIHWWSDGINFKEFIALIIISIFAYLVYFACKKMMGNGLDVLDIEFLKIISSQIVIILCFYFAGGSAEKIIGIFFNKRLDKHNKNNNGGENGGL